MVKIKKYSVLTLLLSGISIIALVLSHLALTDIYHNEGNLILEWTILRISALIFFVFIVATIFTLGKILKLSSVIKQK
jgi:hypothetical protein